MKILVTGPPGCGKTTLVKNVIASSKKKVGGIITEEIRCGGVRVGFKLIDLSTNSEGILSHVEQKKGPRVGKYRVNLPDLDDIGIKAIENAIEEGEVIVIDEIGPMELHSEKFIKTVEKAFDSGKDIIATIHFKSKHPFIEDLKKKSDVLYILNENNRNTIRKEIVRYLNED
jgi:nucleoside-triphosphatase